MPDDERDTDGDHEEQAADGPEDRGRGHDDQGREDRSRDEGGRGGGQPRDEGGPRDEPAGGPQGGRQGGGQPRGGQQGGGRGGGQPRGRGPQGGGPPHEGGRAGGGGGGGVLSDPDVQDQIKKYVGTYAVVGAAIGITILIAGQLLINQDVDDFEELGAFITTALALGGTAASGLITGLGLGTIFSMRIADALEDTDNQDTIIAAATANGGGFLAMGLLIAILGGFGVGSIGTLVVVAIIGALANAGIGAGTVFVHNFVEQSPSSAASIRQGQPARAAQGTPAGSQHGGAGGGQQGGPQDPAYEEPQGGQQGGRQDQGGRGQGQGQGRDDRR